MNYSNLAIEAINDKIERVHLLNCNIHNALLNELFDKVGIGTMIHSNKYEIIREANLNDVQALHNLTKNSVKRDTLLNRSIDAIQEKIADYCVYEIDGSIVAVLVFIILKRLYQWKSEVFLYNLITMVAV